MVGNAKSGKRPAKARNVLTGLLALIVAALTVGFFSTVTFARGDMQKGTLQGEVMALDNSHPLGTVTLQSSKIGNFPNDEINIFVTKDTKTEICNKREPLRDMDVSRIATVIYHEVRGWVPVADSIKEQC